MKTYRIIWSINVQHNSRFVTVTNSTTQYQPRSADHCIVVAARQLDSADQITAAARCMHAAAVTALPTY